MSLSAVVVNALAGFLAFRNNTPDAFGRGIEENRRKGPALPPGRLLRKAAFRGGRVDPEASSRPPSPL